MGPGPARWGVVKALDRVGGRACGQLVLGPPTTLPLTWPWGPMSPLQNVDTHYPLWGSGTPAAAGCPDQPKMTLLYPGQGNHVGIQEGNWIPGSLGQCPNLGHCPCEGMTKGIKQGWLGVLDPCVIWSYPVSKLSPWAKEPPWG